MSFLLPTSRKAVAFSDAFLDFFSNRVSATGKHVNAATALEVSTVVACVRVIGEGIAQVPLKLMQETTGGRSRLPAKKHPLYELLAVRPNPWQTSFEFRETLAWHVVLTGNFFAFKNIVGGKIKELIPFEPGMVTVMRDEFGVLTYQVTPESGRTQIFPASAIWHVRGPSWNTWMGLDAVHMAREAIGLAMATEEQHARMHKNGVQPSGVYSVEGTLDKDQNEKLRGWIEREMGGSANTGRPIVLDRSAKWLSTGLSGVDAEHLATRKHQIEEICRFLRVMPIMVGYSDKAATYASAEQMFLAHVVHTLSPWYQRIEQSIDANLLSEADRAQGYYSQFVEEGLLRGSIEATAAMLDKYVNGGLMTPNEGRAKLDMNPDTDPASDKLRVPANIVGKQPAPKGAANDAQDA
jgi:HK97 family phage portal protein